MAANERLSIKFEAVGAKGLQQAINAIALASDRLVLSQKKYRQAISALNRKQDVAIQKMFDIQTANRNTANTFSVLRSKMLLASFAFLVVGNSIGRLLTASGDLEELINKASVVFGNQFKTVEKWAEALGNATGRATSQILEMATTLQDTFVPLGFSREAATQLSTSLSRLAIDVASFNNQMDDQVARDFQSAIVGNHRTVAKYGIVINEAKLKNEALTLGLIKGTQQLTAFQKVLARVSLIRKGSTDADNDAIKTANSFQNQQKALNAELLESAQAWGDIFKAIVTAGFEIGRAHISILGIMRQLARKEVQFAFAATIGLIGAKMLYTNFTTLKLKESLEKLKNVMSVGNRSLLLFAGVMVPLLTIMQAFIWKNEDAEETILSMEEAIKKAADSAGLLAEGTDAYFTSVSKSIAALEKKITKMRATTAIEKHQAEVTHELTEAEKNLIMELQVVTEEYKLREKALQKLNTIRKEDAKRQVEEQKKLVETAQSIVDLNQTQIDSAKDLKKEKENENISLRNQIATSQKMLESMFGSSEDAMNSLSAKQAKATIETKKALIETNKETIGAQTKIIEENSKKVGLFSDNLKAEIKKLSEMNNELFGEKYFATISTAFKSELIMVSDTLSSMELIMGSFMESWMNKTIGIEKPFRALADTVVSEFVRIAQANSDANIQMIKDNNASDIAKLKQTRRYQKASRAQQEKLEAEITKKNNDRIKSEFKIQKQANKASVTMDFAAAVMKSYKKAPFAAAAYYSILSAIYLAQLEMINSAKAPTMQYGGLVGGNSHAQGGTMIEAEKGEYVVSKQAVDTVGLETLNKINSGQGSSGNINISFQGNVLSQDFIEEEAIPQIKDAIRRGADIGIG